MIAEIIHNLFANQVSDFLAVNYHPFLGDFSDTLAQQLNRLSPVEKLILSKLVKIKNSVSLKNLKTQFKPDKIIELMQAVESLERRSLISIVQSKPDTFYQPNRLISDYLNTAKVTSQNEFSTSVLKPLS